MEVWIFRKIDEDSSSCALVIGPGEWVSPLAASEAAVAVSDLLP